MEILLANRRNVSIKLEAAGYRYVAMDLKGYRSGSLNEGLALNVLTQR